MRAFKIWKVWRKRIEGGKDSVAEVLIANDLTRLTFDVIGQTAFGYNFDTLISGESEISAAFNSILLGGSNLIYRLLRGIIPFFRRIPLPVNIRERKARQLTENLVCEIIKKHREEVDEKAESEPSNLLTILIKAQDEDSGRTMSDELLSNQVFGFMFAGHETTSVALTWTLYLLATHPEHQENARSEVKELLSDSTPVTAEMVDKLEYVTAVINESLRMYPAAPFTLREAIAEDKLGEYDVPKGSVLVIPIVALHKMVEYWDEPDKYKPERFLVKADEGKSSPKADYFLPFSIGPRNCIGRRFALTEMKVVISKILFRFKIDIAPDHPEVHTIFQVTSKPDPAIKLKISLLH